MGHNSFIKGSITHVSLGFSRYLSVQHSTAATFGWGWGALAVPVRARRTPPAAVVVMEVSSVELYSFLFCPSATNPWLHQKWSTELITSAGWWVQGQERKSWLFSVIMSTCKCAHTWDMAGKVCTIIPHDMYPPIITMYLIIGEGCVLTLWSPPPPNPPGPIPQQKFKHTSRWCLSYAQYYPNDITMQIIHAAVLLNNANRQVQQNVHVPVCEFRCVCVCDRCPRSEAVIFKGKVHVHTHAQKHT